MNTSSKSQISIKRIMVKAIVLFILFNFLFIYFKELPYGNISLYNSIFPGRERLPFGETPSVSFNLTLFNLDAMISSHKISSEKKSADEFRIVLLGDSSIWGFLQKPEETLAGRLKNKIDFPCQGKNITVYNLGYPSLSVLKDLVILDKIKPYKPDLVLWFVTLESMVSEEQLNSPLIKNNSLIINRIIKDYQLALSQQSINLLNYTIIGQRRNLADILRLQMYGILWAGSGIDQAYPQDYTPAQRDFEPDASYKNLKVGQLQNNYLATDVVSKAIGGSPGTDFIVVNEPILISQGINSDIRYNYYYPRWAYDKYRVILKSVFESSTIKYYDFWDLIPQSEFTNSAIHLNSKGEDVFAEEIKTIIKNFCDSLGNQ
jgi:hypothetical protein